MSDYPPEAWRQLSRLLKSRRVRLDPRYRNRTTFCSETGLHYKLVQDVEGAPDTRTNFTTETFALLEDAYQLPEGSIRRALGGQPVELPISHEAAGRPLADEPQSEEGETAEPDSPITPDIMRLLQQANDRLEELRQQSNARLDELTEKMDGQTRLIEELQRDRQENGGRRKGA